MGKKLENVTMFVAGDPSEDAPQRVFFTYDVTTGKGAKNGCIHTVEDLDTAKTVETIWTEEIAKIKEAEGIVTT